MGAYSVPVKIMLNAKFVRLPVEDATVNVIVASTESPAAKTAPSLFQSIVIYEPAFDGDQPDVVSDSVTGTFPVFSM